MIARADCAKTIQEEMKMRESKFKNYDALPLTLTAPEVGEVLGISRAAAYELVRSKGSKNEIHHRDRVVRTGYMCAHDPGLCSDGIRCAVSGLSFR